MFNFLKKKILSSTTNNLSDRQAGLQSTTLKLSSLDCPACAIDLDLTLEEIPGIISTKTSYQKSEVKVTFDNKKTSLEQIKKTLNSLGHLK